MMSRSHKYGVSLSANTDTNNKLVLSTTSYFIRSGYRPPNPNASILASSPSFQHSKLQVLSSHHPYAYLLVGVQEYSRSPRSIHHIPKCVESFEWLGLDCSQVIPTRTTFHDRVSDTQFVVYWYPSPIPRIPSYKYTSFANQALLLHTFPSLTLSPFTFFIFPLLSWTLSAFPKTDEILLPDSQVN